ncbi:hypothetical protein ACWEPL_14435 [Nonomuraea sp. NPDC004186]
MTLITRRPGPGQDREVTFTGQMSGGHLYVIPSDARPLIAKGGVLPMADTAGTGLTQTVIRACAVGSPS